MKTAFRQKKSEVIANLLLRLWDKEPGTYRLTEVLDTAWQEVITPLMTQGLDADRAAMDKLMICVC